MRLARKFDQALGVITAIALVVIFGVVLNVTWKNTFAAEEYSEESVFEQGAKFVTFYDDGQKLIVKTEAKTVGEALERVGKTLNEGAIVDPGVETEK